MTKNTKKMKKRTLAINAAAPCTLVNPKKPAMIEIIKKMIAHFNITPSSISPHIMNV
jgi:hypothetical protein